MRTALLAFVGLFALLTASSAGAITILPAEGPIGDGRFTDLCDDGQYLVGFNHRRGAWIDQVQAVCAPFLFEVIQCQK
jgi:hypothetical protein